MGTSTNPTRRPFQRPSPDWLRQKYTVQRMDCTQIARLFGCDAKTPWQWLKDAGIETRPRGMGRLDLLFTVGHVSEFRNQTHTPETRAIIRAKAINRKTVPYLRNGQHWLKSAPPEANPKWKGGITPERQTFYRSPEWKRCAAAVWARDHSCCRRCGLNARAVPKPAIDFDLHHVDGFAIVERRADPDNLVLLCEPCHYWVHGKQNTERLFLGEGQ